MIRYLILFLLIRSEVGSSSSPRILKLCLYLRAIKRTTPECDKVTIDNSTLIGDDNEPSPSATMSPLAKIIANIEKRNEKLKLSSRKFQKLTLTLPLCSANLDDGYKQCRMDITCQSGYSCENKSKSRCCMEPNHAAAPTEERVGKSEEFKTCPSQQQMGYFCQSARARKAWKSCRSDEDCLFANVQKCCDTGCGFKVCVVATGNFTQNTLIFLGN